MERKSEHSLIVTKKKNMTMEEFMYELVGQSFYDLVSTLAIEQQVDFEEDNRFTDRNQKANKDMQAQREERFAKNRQRLNTKSFKLKFPDDSKQPRQLRDILKYF